MKIHVLSLGCARTLVDSEGLAGLLVESGHSMVEEPESADCIVVNTCAFIRSAEEESVSTILDVAELKKTGQLKYLYVAGCLPQKRKNEQEDMLDLLPEVDGFLGPGELTQLPKWIEKKQTDPAQERFFVTSPVPTLLFESNTPKHRLTPKHFAYLKVSEGCDHACAFCSIPQYRGPLRSRSIEDIVEEAKQLVDQGVSEFNLIGQDSSAYGEDRYGAPRLPDLLEALNGVEGMGWIRLLYAHPSRVDMRLIEAIRDCDKVVNYLDIPFQHIADEMLSAMRRETNGDHIRQLVQQFREQIPGVAIRSTFIVGFPGETPAHVDELAQFLQAAKLDRVGMFKYCPEPKTAAARMEDTVSDEEKQVRLDRLMSLQQQVSQQNNERWLGRELVCLVDEPAEEENTFLARTYADAPEVDGQVFVKSLYPLQPGQFVRVCITDAYEYDLVADALPEELA